MRFPAICIRPGLLLLTGLLGACATSYPPEQVKQMLTRSVDSATRLLDQERPIEAAQVVRAARRVDAAFPGLAELDERILEAGAAASDVFAPSVLGSNLQPRIPVERSTQEKILLFLPDRILDLLDIYSIEVHAGPGAYLDVHLTRALQIAGGLRAIVGLGTYSNHSILGVRAHANAGLTVLPVGVQAQGGALSSVGGIRTGSQTLAGLHRPTEDYYQEYEDYWSGGFSLTVLYLGLTYEAHYVQVADFLAGWIGIDFLNDDFARTRALRLSSSEEELVSDLARAARSADTMSAYRRASESQEAVAPDEPTEEADQ